MRVAPPRGMGQGYSSGALNATVSLSLFACDADAQACAQRQRNNRNVIARLVGCGVFIEADADHGGSPAGERQPAFRAVPTFTVRDVHHFSSPFLLCGLRSRHGIPTRHA